MTSFVKINGPMMVVGDPVSGRDGSIHIPAMAHGEMRKPVNGVTVMDEMPFEIVYKNWRNQRFPENALMEVDGVLTVKNGVRTITAKSLRVLVILFHDAYFIGAILHVASLIDSPGTLTIRAWSSRRTPRTSSSTRITA